MLRDVSAKTSGATIFGYHVQDPWRYGTVEFDQNGKVISVEEKPSVPKSSLAVPGLDFYDNRVLDIVAGLRPSPRGELEITDINKAYLASGDLEVEVFSRGFAWFDTGSRDALLEACNFVAAIEKRQGLKIGCPEEVSYRMGFIGASDLFELADGMNNEYGENLRSIAG